jgi:hypothetical protein
MPIIALLIISLVFSFSSVKAEGKTFFESLTPTKAWSIMGIEEEGKQIACGMQASWEDLGATLTVIQDVGDGEVYFDLKWKGNGNFFPNLDENRMKFQFFNWKKHTEKLSTFTYSMSHNQTALVRGVFPEFYSMLSNHEWVRITVDNTDLYIDLGLDDVQAAIREVGKCVKVAKKRKISNKNVEHDG